MSLKEYLQQYTKLQKRIDNLQIILDNWRNFGIRAKSYTYVSPTPDFKKRGYERTLDKIARIENKIIEDIQKIVDMREAIDDLIQNISDPERRGILECHYILGNTWQEVAKQFYISLRTAHCQHNKALSELTPIYYKPQQ